MAANRTKRQGLVGVVLLVVLAIVLGYRCISERAADRATATSSHATRALDEAGRRVRIDRSRLALQANLPHRSLIGRVVDEAGAPIANAEVILATLARTVRSGADGQFRFDDLTDGIYIVEARADDRYAGPINASVGAVPRPVILRLYAAGRVEVACIAAATGAPIANARAGLRMASMFPGAVDVEARTGADGVAIFRAMPATGLEAWCAAERYELRTLGVNSTQEGTWRVRIELAAGIPIRGRVVDDAGAPVAGATIEVAPSPMPMLAGVKGSVRSDRDGTFTYPGVPAGNWVVHADHPAHALGTAAVEVKDHGPPAEVTVVVGDGVEVSGVVVTREDVPVPGAAIEVRFRDGGRLFRTAQADGTGHFDLKGLPHDSLLIVARRDAAASAPTMVDTRNGRGADLVLQLLDDKQIRGIVVDANDRPLPDISVFYVHFTRDDDRATAASVAVTGEDGRFELSGLRDGESYVLTAMRPGHFAAVSLAARSVGVRARAGDDVKIQFPVNGALKGVVRLADGGAAPAGTRVHIGGTPQRVGEDGAFRIDDLPPEQYAVLFDGPGLLEVRRGGVEVKAGETTDLGEIRLARGRLVSGTVRDGDGRPVPAAEVRFVPVGVPGSLGAEADERGRFTRVLPTDRDCDVSASSGGLGATGAQRVPAGKNPITIELRFAKAGRIVGMVRAGGAPARGRMVLLDRKNDAPPSNMETTEADGRFEFVVAGGTYKVSLVEQDPQGGDRFIDREVTVQPGGETRVELP